MNRIKRSDLYGYIHAEWRKTGICRMNRLKRIVVMTALGGSLLASLLAGCGGRCRREREGDSNEPAESICQCGDT